MTDSGAERTARLAELLLDIAYDSLFTHAQKMRHIQDAIIREETGTQWEPMETAPRDGTRVLVDFGKIGVHAVAWEESANGIEIWCVDDRKHGPYALRGYIAADIKGWQPLPAAPDEGGKR